jgi:hypothetical protein
MANPMLDRKAQWRIIEWDPVDKAAYGISGGGGELFRFDVHKGPEGAITTLTQMVAPPFRAGDTMNIPYATLAMAISQKERKIYYVPVTAGDFDYGAVSGDRSAYSMILSYDLKTGERRDVGVIQAQDGRHGFGMGGAKVDKQGRLWFTGAWEEPDPKLAAGRMRGKTYYSLGLGCYDPSQK